MTAVEVTLLSEVNSYKYTTIKLRRLVEKKNLCAVRFDKIDWESMFYSNIVITIVFITKKTFLAVDESVDAYSFERNYIST